MIVNIEKNSFLKPENFVGFNGIWIAGEGVFFDTEDQANKFYRQNATGNEMDPAMKSTEVEGKKYFQKNATNCFD